MARLGLSRWCSSVSGRLLLAILALSLALTGIVTATQLYAEYQKDLQSIESSVSQVREALARTIEISAWEMNIPSLKLILEDAVRLPGLAYVEVTGSGFPVLSAGTRPREELEISLVEPLRYEQDGQVNQVGYLTIVGSRKFAQDRLWQRLWVILAGQAAFIFILSFAILILAHAIILRHLKTMAHYVRGLRLDQLGQPLRFDRKPRSPGLHDELDEVADAINAMRKTLHSELEQRQNAEQETSKSRERFELAMRGANDGLWDWDLRTGQIYYSPRWAEMLGLPAAERVSTVDEWTARVHPDDQQPTLAKVKHHLASGDEHFEGQFRMRHQDGRYRWILSRGFTMRDDKEQPYRFIGINVDISGRMAAEEEIRKLSHAVEQSPVPVLIASPTLKVEYVNGAFSRQLNLLHAQVIGRRLDELKVFGSEGSHEERDFWKSVHAFSEWKGELRISQEAGGIEWAAVSVVPIFDNSGQAMQIMVMLEDTTERRRYEERLLVQANYDSLTGLPNRNLADDRLQQAIVQARSFNTQVAVLFLDLDQFKYVNDTYGHAAGDELLRKAAKRLQQCMHAEYTVARFGGDEFLIILPSADTLKDVGRLVDRIERSFAKPFIFRNRTVFVTASIGISQFPADGMSAESLVQHADVAMYQAKRSGRNTHRFFLPEMNKEAASRLRVETALRFAVEQKEFEVHYQPFASLASGRIVGAEALLRWKGASLGAVSPGVFIPIAEDTGLVEPIGSWLIEEACKQLKAWRDQHGYRGSVAINVSSQQFRNGGIVAQIVAALDKYQLPAGCLEIEITERVVLDQSDEVVRELAQLHHHGIKLSIDDFGTGYSSLSYLQTFPFHKLKIDQSFVRQLRRNEQSASLVVAIIAMAKSLDKEVVAEGIEHAEEWRFLADAGCDYGQGYWLGMPMSAMAFSELIPASPQLSPPLPP